MQINPNEEGIIEEISADMQSTQVDENETSNFDISHAFIIALAIILLFYSGNKVGSLTGSNVVQTTQEETVTLEPESTTIVTTVAAQDTEEETTGVSINTATDDTTQTTVETTQTTQTTETQEEVQEETEEEVVAAMPSTTQEILDLFNTSANNVKVNASEVIRNYELVSHDESKLDLPSALQSIGNTLISQLVTDDMTSITYTEEQDFIDHFPISGGYGNVNVTSADISNATITDNGNTYTIFLEFNDCVDPVDTGVGSAFSLVSKEYVMSITSIIKDCTFSYYDCELTAIIEKDTGNLIEADYYMPVCYDITASLGFTLEAQVATIVETNYTVNY